MKNALSAAEVRAAKKYLTRRGYESSRVSPRLFAKASKEMDCPFSETLNLLEEKTSGNGPDAI
tara:strand:- start:3888 stop:4076 length:189 start_codon:yes stop_codon:yes gene_type:complete